MWELELWTCMCFLKKRKTMSLKMTPDPDDILQYILEDMYRKTSDDHIQNLALLIKVLLARIQQLESLIKEDKNDT